MCADLTMACLLLACRRATAFMCGRNYVIPFDIAMSAYVCLPHRVVLLRGNDDFEARGDLIAALLSALPSPQTRRHD